VTWIESDVLLNELAADTLLADKGYNADERVIERLEHQGKTAVIPQSAIALFVVSMTRTCTKHGI